MKAVILAGGLGTRLGEETSVRPKPMVEIGGMPILWHVMKIYSAAGINEFVVCLGYKGYMIKEYFANYFLHSADVTIDLAANSMEWHDKRSEPWRITLVETGAATQTGGRLKAIRDYLGDDELFCFTYGDGVAAIDVAELIAFHRAHGKLATVTAVSPPGRFGALEFGRGDWGRSGPFVSRETRGRRRTHQRRVLRRVSRGARPGGGAGDLVGAGAARIAGARRRARRLPLRRLLAADGHVARPDAPGAALAGRGTVEGLVTGQILGTSWSGRRVFLTGHTGFKGSWLALWLSRLGAQVTGFALPAPTSPSLFEQARVAEHVTHIEGDVRDADAVEQAMRAAKPELVLHLAAQSLVRYSYDHPIETYATNVMGTAHVLEAARRVDSVRACVCITTDKCYENREWAWPYRERDPMGGHDPYSSSKGAAELVIAAYRRSFFAGRMVASVRAGNVIGGGDYAADRLVPDIVRAVAAGERPLVRAPGSVRPWQHVLEALGGYLILAERLLAGEDDVATAWNFGPAEDDARPVGWVVERLLAAFGAEGWDRPDGAQPHEAAQLRLDCSLARARLGWRPVFDLAEALDLVAEWHTVVRAGEAAGDVSLRQIAAYEARLRATMTQVRETA